MELDIKLLLIYIRQDDYEGMLRFLPQGIEHRASRYNTPDDFELAGYYEEDARYIYPARDKMKEACLDICIKNIY